MRRRSTSQSILLPWERQGYGWERWISRWRWDVLFRVLAGVVVVVGLVHAAVHESRWRTTRVALREVHRAIFAFRSDFDRCPVSIAELVHPPPPGERYLREVPRDGWGTPLYVRCRAAEDSTQAEVVSAGPDRSFFSNNTLR